MSDVAPTSNAGLTLDAAVDLPLGTVLADHLGVQHVFYGTQKGKGGVLQHCFIPRAEYRDPSLPVPLSGVNQALRHFPGLNQYLREGVTVEPCAPTPAAGAVDLQRLENVLDLPIGTVLTDTKNIEHVFIGRSANTAGLIYHFIPRAGSYRNAMQASFSLVDGGFRKFPGLRAYVRAGVKVPQ